MRHRAISSYIATRPAAKHLRMRSQKAFSIIEMMIVVAIVGVLSGVAVPAYQEYISRSESYETQLDMTSISIELDDFLLENNRLPNSLVEIGRGLSVDSWGNPYQYLNIASAKGNGKLRKDKNLVPINTDYDLYSMGPDGQSVSPLTAKSSKDDIIRANDGAYYGIAADY
ncbi:MAG: general secretion pathway protein G [Halioglobus sp.]|jgi:general secretion pathway protein G